MGRTRPTRGRADAAGLGPGRPSRRAAKPTGPTEPTRSQADRADGEDPADAGPGRRGDVCCGAGVVGGRSDASRPDAWVQVDARAGVFGCRGTRGWRRRGTGEHHSWEFKGANVPESRPHEAMMRIPWAEAVRRCGARSGRLKLTIRSSTTGWPRPMRAPRWRRSAHRRASSHNAMQRRGAGDSAARDDRRATRCDQCWLGWASLVVEGGGELPAVTVPP